MALVVGLDIGTRTLTGVVMAGTSRKYRLVDFFVEEFPSIDLGDVSVSRGGEESPEVNDDLDMPLSREEFIQKVLRDRRLEGAEIVTALDAKDCGIRELPVPFTREEQIEKTVAFEAEQHFLAFDLDDIVLEWLKIGESNGRSQLVVFAARNESVVDHLETLSRAEVDPAAVDLDATALANAFCFAPYYDETKSALLIDMGATSTKIVLMQGGELKKVRALRTGAATLDRRRMVAELAGGSEATAGGGESGGFDDSSIEARLQEIEDALRRLEPVASEEFDVGVDAPLGDAPIAILSDEDYERVREKEGAATETAPSGDVSPLTAGAEEGFDYREYLRQIGTEIQRTFATAQLDAPIELICLCGGLSRRDEAKRFFQEQFDIDTVELSFGDALPMDVSSRKAVDLGAEGAVAVGLAAKGVGLDRLKVDFRKGPFRYEHRFEKLRYPLLNCAIFCFLVFMQTAYWSFHTYQENRQLAEGYEKRNVEAYEEFFEKKVTKGRDPLRSANAQIKRWQDGGLGNIGRYLPFEKVIDDFSKVLDSTNLHFRIKNMNFALELKKRGKRGKRGTTGWSGGKSSCALVLEGQASGHLVETKFNDRASRYFDASSTSKPTKDGRYSVNLSLTVKDSVLQSNQ